MIPGQKSGQKGKLGKSFDTVEDPHDWYDQYGVTYGFAYTYIFRIYKTFWCWTPLSCQNTQSKMTKIWHRFDVLYALRNFTHMLLNAMERGAISWKGLNICRLSISYNQNGRLLDSGAEVGKPLRWAVLLNNTLSLPPILLNIINHLLFTSSLGAPPGPDF